MTRHRTLIAALGLAVLSVQPAHAGPKETALFEAVRDSNPTAVRQLLSQRADPNLRLPDQSSVLAWAVDRQDAGVVRQLLAAGARTDLADVDGATPLILACQLADPAIIGLLLDARADVKAVRSDGVRVLSICAGDTTPAVLERMIAAGAEPDAADASGQTPLMWAAAKGRLDNIALLLKHGADVNRASLKGFTPLFFAIKSKEPKAALALLEAGADRTHRAADGTSAVQLAVYQGKLALAGNLVGQGVDLKAWDRNGEQLLHAATAAGDETLVDLLLSKAADPNALTGPSTVEKRRERNQGGVLPKEAPTTPLLIAARNGSDRLMRRLVAAGARPDFRAEDGGNVILAAAAGRSRPALEYALQIGGDVNAVSEGGQSALHTVAGRWSGPDAVAMIRTLVDRGARLDLKNARGMTPQDVALRNGGEDVRAAFAELPKAKGATKVAQTASAPSAR